MSFTAAEKVSIAKIVGVSTIQLDTTLAAYAEHISADAEESVRADISRWEAADAEDPVSIEPTESNKGIRIESGGIEAKIRRNIATLLFLTDMVYGEASQGVLVRG